VYQYFQDNGLGLTLVPDGPPPALPAGSTVPPGLGISITLNCPAHTRPSGGGYKPSLPSCH
jgi:hypothetical protein